MAGARLPGSGRPDGLADARPRQGGRHPTSAGFRQWSPEDERAVEAALELHRHRGPARPPLDSASLGPAPAAWLAVMTLAQDTDLLLLDEASIYLDLGTRSRVL